MAFNRPTLAELIARAQGDIETNLPGTDARLRRSNLDVLARTHAGAMHGVYGFLQWMADQVIYDTAEAEFLERWSSVWGINRIPAAPAQGNITFTGTNGTLIPAGTVLIRSDGAEFDTDADATIASGSATAAVTALVAGAAGNMDAAATLSLASPIAGVNGTATVDAGGLTQGADIEADAALRTRLLARIQQPPHGGASFDYIAWALEIAGVTRAWVYPQELGVGTVSVRFVRDNDASIIPDAGEVAAVQTYIDARRPVTAAVTVVAPIADALNFTIAVTPNTAAVKDAVEAELADLIKRESEPGVTLLLSHIRAAISIAAGETNYTMTAPAADVTHATGHMATMGTITWA